MNVWRIGKRQLIAIGIGIIIYGIFSYALDLLFNSAANSSNSPLFNPIIGGSPYAPSLGGILGSLTLAIFWFFGAEFGPWVGLAIALVGSLLADILSGFLAAYHIYWYVYASYAILGFFPGLALLRTQGCYKTAGAIIIAIVMTVIGIIIGDIFTAAGDSIVYHINFFADLLSLFFAYFIGLILLSILLVIYNAVAKGSSYP